MSEPMARGVRGVLVNPEVARPLGLRPALPVSGGVVGWARCRGAHRVRRALAAVLLLLGVVTTIAATAQPAAALVPPRWELLDVTLADGSTLTGSFRFNPTTNRASELDVTQRRPDGTTQVFNTVRQNSFTGPRLVVGLASPDGDLTGTSVLVIVANDPLGSGGSRSINAASEVAACANPECSAATSPRTAITGGLLTTNAPLITSLPAVTVFEGQTVAYDANAEGKGLTYGLFGGADQSKFTIDPTTGIVRFVSPTDFENPDDANGDRVYEVGIRVTDNNSRFDDIAVRVTVADRFEGLTTWTLDGVEMGDAQRVAGTLTGSFKHQASPFQVADINLTFTPTFGTDTISYTQSIPANPGGAAFIRAVTDASGDLTGRNGVSVAGNSALSNGGTIDINPNSRIFTCGDPACNALADPIRQALRGRLISDAQPPTITSPSTASIFEGRSGSLDIQSSDDTDSEGSGLVYRIVGGADQARFNIASNTGVLTFATPPNFDAPGDANGDQVYEVDVQVLDSTGQSATQSIRYTVRNVNEPPTTWTLSDLRIGQGFTGEGTFRHNPATGRTSLVNVRLTNPGGTPGPVFTSARGDQSNQQVVLLTDLDDQGRRSALIFRFDTPLSLGGTIDIGLSNGISRLVPCTNADCSAVDNSAARPVVGGRVVSGTTAPTFTSPANVTVPQGQRLAVDVNVTDDIDREGDIIAYTLVAGPDRNRFFIDHVGRLLFRSLPDSANPDDANSDGVYDVWVRATDSTGQFRAQNILVRLNSRTTTWTLQNVTLQNGSLAGSFEFDPSTNEVTSINITSRLGFQDGPTFVAQHPATSRSENFVGGVSAAQGDLTGQWGLYVSAAASLRLGGTVDIQVAADRSQIFTCGNANCSSILDPRRAITGGQLVADSTAPTITSPATASVLEGQTSAIDVQASDDRDSESSGLLYSFAGGADDGAFNLDSNGVLTFQVAPSFANPGDANGDNVYKVSVRVTDSSGLFVDQAIRITITSLNGPPTITAIGDQTVDEGSTTSIPIAASDPNGDALGLSATGTPSFCTLADAGDGTGSLDCSPGAADAGVYPITVSATETAASGLSASTSFNLTVIDVNQAPVVAPIADQSVDEGGSISIAVSASDPDGDGLTLEATGLPAFCGFTDAGGGSGTIQCDPGFDDTGRYRLTATATDNGSPQFSGSASFTLFVLNSNRAPVVAAIADQSVDEGGTGFIQVSATDPDGDTIALSSDGLPGFCVFDSSGGEGTIRCMPDFNEAGAYPVTVIATDNGSPALTGSTAFNLTVNDVNRPPLVNFIEDQFVDEGATISIELTGGDFDGNTITYSATGLPGFCSLTNIDSSRGSIDCSPGFTDAGVTAITVIGTDDGTPNLTAQRTFNLTVRNVNRAPIVNDVGDQFVAEGERLVFDVTSADPDGDNVALTARDLPGFCVLTDNGDRSGSVDCGPGFLDSGVYSITVIGTDDGTPNLTAERSFSLTVREVNDPPVVDAGPDTTIEVPNAVQLTGSATDDGNPNPPGVLDILWSQISGPGVVTFADRSSPVTTATFSTGGVYVLQLGAGDGQLGTIDRVTIVVENPLGCTILGTNGDDVLNGTPGPDVICGFDGADRINGAAGDDTIYGGDGPDTIRGQLGNDIIDGGMGDDNVRGDGGNDMITDSGGADRINGNAGNDNIDAGPGNDVVTGAAGNDIMVGGPGNDAMFGLGGNDDMSGGDGRDNLLGGSGDDTLRGGDNRDTLYGLRGDDQMFGGAGRDLLSDLFGTNVFDGGPGEDRCVDTSGATAC